jgi:hypothetical protein
MFFRDIIEYFKIKRIVDAVIKEEDLLNNFSHLFSTENYEVNFKTDWISRIYAVVNPIVQDPQSRIFEYDEKGTNLNSFVSKWVIEHMIAADTFVKNHELFDILVYDCKQIDDNYNFLITLTPITWFDLQKSLKRVFCIELPIAIVVAIAIITILLVL